MKVRLSSETWDAIMHEIRLADGLLDNGHIKPEQVSEYLSEQSVEINFNKMVQIKD
jgi:hypothetical protein